MIDNVLSPGTRSGYPFVLAGGAAVGGVVSNYPNNSDPVPVDPTRLIFVLVQPPVAISAAAKATEAPIGN